MNITEALQQIDDDPDAWLNREDVRGKVWEMLGKPCGTWQHDRCDRCGGDCVRCGASDNLTCPVPPPLDEPPEVVARKLRDECTDSLRGLVQFRVARANVWGALGSPGISESSSGWYSEIASPHQQILACLVAGRKVTE